jgi:hypothetical protein
MIENTPQYRIVIKTDYTGKIVSTEVINMQKEDLTLAREAIKKIMDMK